MKKWFIKEGLGKEVAEQEESRCLSPYKGRKRK